MAPLKRERHDDTDCRTAEYPCLKGHGPIEVLLSTAILVLRVPRIHA